MTTATAKEKPLDLQVDFSPKIATGDVSSSVGIKVSRNRLPDKVAVQNFCSKRIDARIRLSPANGEDARQMHDPEDGYAELEGHADSGRVSIGPSDITFRLKFSHDEIDKHVLADFAKGSGTLTVRGVEDIPEPDDDEDDEDTSEDAAPVAGRHKRAFTGKDEGIGLPMKALCDYGFPEKFVEALIDACDGDTIGHLEIRQRDMPSTWMKDIEGLGGKSQPKLVNAYDALRHAYPQTQKGADTLPFEKGAES